MAEIIINEISQNYTYNIGANSFATVALPITASWGPGLFAVKPSDITDEKLEELVWKHFPATQAGLESFVATYRGAAALYRTAKDYSYQMAVSLLSAGYDVLVCRVSPGKAATGICGGFDVTAKYVGTFGNNIKLTIAQTKADIFNVITYAVDASGVQTALENLFFTTDETKVSDSVIYIDEFESAFVVLSGESNLAVGGSETAKLAGGTDYADAADTKFDTLWDWFVYRYKDYAPADDIQVAATAIYPFDDEQSFKLTAKVAGIGGDELSAKLSPNGAKAVGSLTYKVNTEYTADGLDIKAKSYGAYANGYTAEVSGTDTYTLTIKSGNTTLETVEFTNPATIVSAYVDVIPFTTDPSTTSPTLVPTATLEGGEDFVLNIYTKSEADAAETSGRFVLDEAAHIQDTNKLVSALDLVNITIEVEDGGATIIPTSVEFSGGGAAQYVESEYGEAILKTRDKELSISNFYKQQIYSMAFRAYDCLNDKLSYNFNRVISPGWDDQDIAEFGGEFTKTPIISALHHKLMAIGYHSRCGAAFLDVPKSLPRKFVSDDGENEGYAQKLSRYITTDLYNTHSALFAPWGQYVYAGTSKQATASPSFLALLISRAMILNQSLQYEWCLPTNRSHNLKLGKFDYSIPAQLLKEWQSLEGVGINCLTSLPDLGNTLWGNSTLFEVPPATYQALANLSTRFLMNAVKDVVYKCGISITFQYNNGQAYDRFYAGVTPILDTMKNVGAIKGYYVRMSQDINAADQINANTIIGKVYLVVEGVINDLVVDLVALPPQTDISQFGE